jgi:hypothetical protein
MPQEIAATWSRIGSTEMMERPRIQPKAIVQRHPGARDGGGAGSAICLEHVAIDGHLPLAERRQVDHGAERAADQALDLLRSTGRLAGRDLAAGALVRRPRQHRVFAVTQPRPDPRSQGGPRSSSDAVHRTRVLPNETRQEPSAYFATPRSSVTGRSSSCRRFDGRIG